MEYTIVKKTTTTFYISINFAVQNLDSCQTSYILHIDLRDQDKSVRVSLKPMY